MQLLKATSSYDRTLDVQTHSCHFLVVFSDKRVTFWPASYLCSICTIMPHRGQGHLLSCSALGAESQKNRASSSCPLYLELRDNCELPGRPGERRDIQIFILLPEITRSNAKTIQPSCLQLPSSNTATDKEKDWAYSDNREGNDTRDQFLDFNWKRRTLLLFSQIHSLCSIISSGMLGQSLAVQSTHVGGCETLIRTWH